MPADDPSDLGQSTLARIRAGIAIGAIRLTQHAQQEMYADAITLDAVLEALNRGQLLEDYPEHRRGPCCLIGGRSASGRFIHVVCATGQIIVIITVYEPTPPKWVTPTQRRLS